MKSVWFSLAMVLAIGCGDGGGAAGSGSASSKPAGSAANSAKPAASAAATATAAASAAATATGSASAGEAGAIVKLLEDLQTNEANYKDKPVKVEALYLSTSSMTSGGKKTYNISVTDKKGDLDNTLSCELGETEPKDLMQYDAVVIEGKGSVSNAQKGDKKFKSLRLTECKFTKK
jgi:hypothetical protein